MFTQTQPGRFSSVPKVFVGTAGRNLLLWARSAESVDSHRNREDSLCQAGINGSVTFVTPGDIRRGIFRDFTKKKGEFFPQIAPTPCLCSLMHKKIIPASEICDKGKRVAVLTQIQVQNSALGGKCLFFSTWKSPGSDGSRLKSHSSSSDTCPATQSSQPPLSQEILREIESHFITINSFFLLPLQNPHIPLLAWQLSI